MVIGGCYKFTWDSANYYFKLINIGEFRIKDHQYKYNYKPIGKPVPGSAVNNYHYFMHNSYMHEESIYLGTNEKLIKVLYG